MEKEVLKEIELEKMRLESDRGLKNWNIGYLGYVSVVHVWKVWDG